MIQYIYFVKCPDVDDEPFDFFDDAKSYALNCLSSKPTICQVEVDRNDFGECVNSTDLGQIWSWEDEMSDVSDDTVTNAFDLEFDDADISGESILDSVPDNFRRPVPADMTIEGLVEAMEENEDVVECKECFNLVTKESCTKSDHGYICKECAGASLEEAGNLSDIAAAYNSEHPDAQIHASDLEDTIYGDAPRNFDGFETKREFNKEYNLIRKRKPVDEFDRSRLSETFEDEDEMDEDTVQCTWCEELFDRSECRYEVDLGWLCSRCEAAIKSRGETLTFREGSYWDLLDEEAGLLAETDEQTILCPECGEHTFGRLSETCSRCGFSVKEALTEDTPTNFVGDQGSSAADSDTAAETKTTNTAGNDATTDAIVDKVNKVQADFEAKVTSKVEKKLGQMAKSMTDAVKNLGETTANRFTDIGRVLASNDQKLYDEVDKVAKDVNKAAEELEDLAFKLS
jgi:hypothetical protein